MIVVGDCQCGRNYRQSDPVLSPKQALRGPPGNEGVTRVQHKPQQRLYGFLYLGEPCEAVTSIRPVTPVIASPEFAKRHDDCTPQITVHLFARPSHHSGQNIIEAPYRMIGRTGPSHGREALMPNLPERPR